MRGALPVLKFDLRNHIVGEIKRIATENGGKSPGMGVFERETGIKKHEWRGKFWAKWGDALNEAGLTSNELNRAYSDEVILTVYARVVRVLGKVPSFAELALAITKFEDVPNAKVISGHFGNKTDLLRKFRQFCESSPEHADLLVTLDGFDFDQSVEVNEGINSEGSVYLLKSGPHYKIGRSAEIERRVKQISVALPEATELVHAIRTDDPSGIEAYWHRRFADRRANGEWFKLTTKDVTAFKKRKFQ